MSDAPEWTQRRARPLTIVIAAVAGHLALLVVGRGVLATLSGGAALETMLPLATSAAAIVLAAPIGSRLFYRADANAWWLVAPAAAVVAVGALRGTSASLAVGPALGVAAVTAFGAALALSTSATILAVRASTQATSFIKSRAALPLLVGMGGLAAVAVAAVQRMPPSLLPLPPALIGVVAIAVTSAAVRRGDPRQQSTGDAVLIGWISLASVALASYATGAATLAASSSQLDALPEGRRIILASWFHSFPVVAAMIAGFGLRLAQVGVATRSRKLDVLGTVGLLVLSVAIARNQIRGAFHLAAPAKGVALAKAAARPAPQPVAAPGPPASASEPAPTKPEVEFRTMRVGMPTVDGGLLAKDALGPMRRIIARLNACYEQRRPPRQPGTADLRFIVDRRGSVAHVELQNSTLAEGVGRCVQSEMYRTGFASPSSDKAVIVAPIEFVELPATTP